MNEANDLDLEVEETTPQLVKFTSLPESSSPTISVDTKKEGN